MKGQNIRDKLEACIKKNIHMENSFGYTLTTIEVSKIEYDQRSYDKIIKENQNLKKSVAGLNIY